MEPGRGCARGARAFPGRCASRRGGRESKASWEPGAQSGRSFSGGGEFVAGVDAGRGEKRLEVRGWEAQAGFGDASGLLGYAVFRGTCGCWTMLCGHAGEKSSAVFLEACMRRVCRQLSKERCDGEAQVAMSVRSMQPLYCVSFTRPNIAVRRPF